MTARPPLDAGDEGLDEARQTGVLVWGSVAGKLSEAIAPIVIARLLGKAEYGAFGALMLVYATLAIISSAGLPKVLLLFFSDASQAQRRTSLRMILGVTVALAALDALLLVGIGVYGRDALAAVGAELAGTGRADTSAVESLAYLPWLGLYALFDIPTRLWPNLAIATRRPRAAAGAGLFRSIGTLCATAVPAGLGLGVEGMLGGMLIFGAVNLLGFAGFARGALGRGPLGKIPWTVRHTLRYALWLGATEVVNVLNAHLDQWLILVMSSAETVAEYRNGAWQIPVVTTIAYSLASVQLPRLTRYFQAGEGRRALQLWRHSAERAALVVVPITMIFVVGSEELMVVAFGPRYARSGDVFFFYGLLTMARITAFGSFLMAAGRPRLILVAASLTLAFNFAISVPLAWTFGFIGPAAGTALAFVPTVWIYSVLIARASGASLKETFPFGRFVQVVLASLPGVVLAKVILASVPLVPAARLALYGLCIPALFVPCARALGILRAEDLSFAREWISMRALRRPERP